MCYWFFIPVVTRYFRIGLLIAGAAVFFHITTAEGLIAFYENGHGPLAALPLVVQMLIFLVGEDVITYWTHRLFHGGRLWKYHAVHYSSEELEWISAARFHPINLFFGAVIADVVLLIAGISPSVFVVLGPVTIAHSAFVHANLDWTFGPFKYVIATPVFHRWHHTAAERGGEKNFRRDLPGPRPDLRHLLHARRRKARPVRHRRSRVSDELRRPVAASVHAIARRIGGVVA